MTFHVYNQINVLSVLLKMLDYLGQNDDDQRGDSKVNIKSTIINMAEKFNTRN